MINRNPRSFLNHIPIHTKIIKIIKETPTINTLTLELPILSPRPSPGQFYMVWIPGQEEIPLSPSGCSSNGELSFAIRSVGPTTTYLNSLKKGQKVALRGPYGQGYHLDFNPEGKEILIIGGGVGLGPLRHAVQTLYSNKAILDLLLGSKTKIDLLYHDDFQKMCRDLQVSTDDGSFGEAGIVTDLLKRKIKENHPYSSVIICGPEPMLASVVKLLNTTDLQYQISLHRIMKCGVGLCGSCGIGHIISCRDGPVLMRKEVEKISSELGVYTRLSDGSKKYFE